MTGFYKPFRKVDGAFKSSVDKLIPIRDLCPFKILNMWDIIVYCGINDYFYQKLHHGMHNNTLMN